MDEPSSRSLQRFHTLSERASALARCLPGGDFALRQARAAEDLLMEELRWRLDRERGNDNLAPGSASEPDTDSRSPGSVFQDLLQRSLDQRPPAAEKHLYLRLLDQLLPDEARILAATSGGTPIAICHLEAANRLGTARIPVILYASRIGNEAGVMLTRQVPNYLAHLCTLNLLQTGTEDKNLGAKYELIENDSAFRKGLTLIEDELSLRPRITRATAHLSPLGRDLWQACHTTTE